MTQGAREGSPPGRGRGGSRHKAQGSGLRAKPATSNQQPATNSQTKIITST